MSLKVAVQMDPVEGINIETDTSFMMMMEAQSRGHQLWVYTPDKLSLEGGRVTARARPLTVRAASIRVWVPRASAGSAATPASNSTATRVVGTVVERA